MHSLFIRTDELPGDEFRNDVCIAALEELCRLEGEKFFFMWWELIIATYVYGA